MTPLNAMIQARDVEHQKDALRLARHISALKQWSDTARDRAQGMVEKWRTEKLCSPIYINEWDQLLTQSAAHIEGRITACDDMAVVLRRNSPILMTMERPA